MPVFECSRCNEMTYSSSKTNRTACPTCGAQRKRLVSDAASFAEAKRIPRAVSHGDHSIAVFDDFAQVAGVAVDFIRHGLEGEALVMAALPQELEDLVLEELEPDEARGIAWEPASDSYGPLFNPHSVIGRFREIAEIEPRPVFVVGCADEPIQDFTSLEGWVQYERMAHETAVEYGMTVLCLYDARLHDERMLEAGLVTHGLAASGSERLLRRNEQFDYEPPAA
ncbi:MAG TPA: MEDS domain-containing protein [Solirubrobacteraceae bacterium]|nr:MEDS domain-containing protein [Solirubrobacteraceae bacterium]